MTSDQLLRRDSSAKRQRKLEPVENTHDEFVDNFITGLWDKHAAGDAKWPGEDVRLKLARREMAPEPLGQYLGLIRSKSRLEARIKSLTTEIGARRSLLSALKVEMEATSR